MPSLIENHILLRKCSRDDQETQSNNTGCQQMSMQQWSLVMSRCGSKACTINAYAYPLYVCCLCSLIFLCLLVSMYVATCLCTSVCAYGFLCLLMPLMYAYVYLSICLWVMTSVKEFSVGLRRKGSV
jgi:hypothetical protein